MFKKTFSFSCTRWLPERSELEKHMELAVDSAYVHGRQWIATNVTLEFYITF